MSAESVYDWGAPASDGLGRPMDWLEAAAAHDDPVAPSVDTLCETFGPVCASAVDPLEIASALEFEGIGDRTAQVIYGQPDVFALAQAMYLRVPRRPAEPEPSPAPWAVSPYRPVLHGLLYGLPAICFPAAGALLAGPGALTTLIVALLVAWGLSQGLACVGYLRLGTAGPAQTRRVLRAGLLAGLILVTAAMMTVWLVLHAHRLVLLFGAGEGAYMLGACVLMVFGAERWLPAALAPGVLGAAAFLFLGRPPGLEHLAWIAMAGTPVLACVLALIWTRRTEPRNGHLLIPAELRAALPAIGFGLVAAGLLAFPVAAGPDGHGGINTGALLASLPLSLSMGAAEWSMLWYRARTQHLLRVTASLPVFRAKARLVLLIALLQYLLGATALTVLVAAIAGATGLVHLRWAYLPEVAAYLALGSAMFLALLLQSLRLRAVPLIAGTAALAAEIVFRQHGLAVQVAAPVALFAVLGCYAGRALGRAARHGY